jgi:hypothetical protein
VIFWVFCFVLFCLPLIKAFEFEVNIITFSPYTIGLLALLPFACFRAFQRYTLYGLRPVDFAIAILGLTFFQSTLLSDDIIRSGFLAFHALFIPFVSYFIVKIMIQSENQFRAAIFSLQTGVFLFSIATILMYAQQGQRPFVFNIPPIGVATLCCMAIVQLLFGYARWNSMRIIGLLTAFTALAVTFSRVYILLICISFIIIRLTRSRWVVPMWLATLVVTLIMTIMVSAMINPKGLPMKAATSVNTWERITDPESYARALSGRVYSYRMAFDDFLKNPMFGTGMQKGEGMMITPHNFHVEWLTYGGMFGYIVYAAVFLLHVMGIRRAIRKDRWLTANLAAVFIVLMNSLTNGFMHGIMPCIAFILMGFNEARFNVLNKALDDGEEKTAPNTSLNFVKT